MYEWAVSSNRLCQQLNVLFDCCWVRLQTWSISTFPLYVFYWCLTNIFRYTQPIMLETSQRILPLNLLLSIVLSIVIPSRTFFTSLCHAISTVNWTHQLGHQFFVVILNINGIHKKDSILMYWANTHRMRSMWVCQYTPLWTQFTELWMKSKIWNYIH